MATCNRHDALAKPRVAKLRKIAEF